MIRDNVQDGEKPVLTLEHALRDGRRRQIRVSHRIGHGGVPYLFTIALWDLADNSAPSVLGYIRLNRDEVRPILDALAPLAE